MVLSSTRMQPSVSNAWPSIRNCTCPWRSNIEIECAVPKTQFTRLGKALRSRASRALDLFQLLEFRFGRVVTIKGVAAADKTVARRGRAVTESATDKLGREFAA